MASKPDVTAILTLWGRGNPGAINELLPLVYAELRRSARNYLRHERAGHTLEPTALVNEVYLRLIDQHSVDWSNRAHFFSIAAEMMRRILVNHAINRRAQKRGAGETLLSIDEVIRFPNKQNLDLVALDDALNRLAEFDELQARIVELRFFAGLTNEEVAEVLAVSESTVKREWRSAKAWLAAQLI